MSPLSVWWMRTRLSRASSSTARKAAIASARQERLRRSSTGRRAGRRRAGRAAGRTGRRPARPLLPRRGDLGLPRGARDGAAEPGARAPDRERRDPALPHHRGARHRGRWRGSRRSSDDRAERDGSGPRGDPLRRPRAAAAARLLELFDEGERAEAAEALEAVLERHSRRRRGARHHGRGGGRRLPPRRRGPSCRLAQALLPGHGRHQAVDGGARDAGHHRLPPAAHRPGDQELRGVTRSA